MHSHISANNLLDPDDDVHRYKQSKQYNKSRVHWELIQNMRLCSSSSLQQVSQSVICCTSSLIRRFFSRMPCGTESGFVFAGFMCSRNMALKLECTHRTKMCGRCSASPGDGKDICKVSASTLPATGMMERTSLRGNASLSNTRQVLGSGFVAPRPMQR